MDTTLAQQAIDFALSGDWEGAIKTNQQILKDNPNDVDSLNRTARAYAEMGQIGKAKEAANKVIKIDPINTIALKCLEKWKKVTKIKKETEVSTGVNSFLEEPGKTKMVKLINAGDESVFANLAPGEEVKLNPFAHRVSVTTLDGSYIGRLPDDLATRLKNLIKEGNKYRVLVKSVGHRDVDVFIRETERGERVKTLSSFTPEKIDYVAFTPPELVHSDTPLESSEETAEES